MLASIDAPVERTVHIRWSTRQIPVIEAEIDGDLAAALGIVHAHLRAAQIEMMRRIATGRLAEVLGSPAAGLDQAMRTIDFVRAGQTAFGAMHPEARRWAERFLDGINHQIAGQRELPPDLGLIGLRPTPWSINELMAVMRLASTDFTWKVWLRLMKLRGRPGWESAWSRLIGGDALPEPGLTGLGGVFDRFGRPGSNAYALAGDRTATGKPLLAGDPHLGIQLPNLWLAVGLRSPGYHAVGLMVPAVPMLGLGRNPHIAWGGTNLHAASSELVKLRDQGRADIRSRFERVALRSRRARDIRIRDSAFGPVISDAALIDAREPLALHWMGHRPSDEVKALLDVARARDWDMFRAALAGYAIPGLTLVYADASGRIGRMTAATLPRRPQEASVDIVSEAQALDHWRATMGPDQLPQAIDPAEGYIVSANEAPPAADIVVGRFFSPDDRVDRLREVLGAAREFRLEDISRLQQDVGSSGAVRIRARIVPHLPDDVPVAAALREWDGRYTEDSAGALAFELVVARIVRHLPARRSNSIFGASWAALEFLDRQLGRLQPTALATIVARAAREAAPKFRRFGRWGEIHRLRLGHPLMHLPLIGRRYLAQDQPVGGSNETLMKTRHDVVRGRHAVKFGAQARHVFDLSDLDANYFVLLGGQDGWLGSTTFADHLSLWRSGRFIRVPLRTETVRVEHPHVTVLSPRKRKA